MSKYIAAISGGPDSMTMLHMYQKQIVAVCHINYKKRLSADRDMRIVQEFCKKSGIPFECMIVTKNEYDKYFNITNNFQTVARMIRYDFFIKNVKKHKADAILVAHNKDDFLETAFLQMKRKSKTLFLGIEKNSMYKGVKIYRPLLNKWKNELLTYCQRNQIEYGIDETNQTDLYERNRIRKALSTITSKEKENEFKRIVRSNKNKQKKYCEVIKKYDLWKLHNFALSFYQKSSKFIHEHLIYQFLIENNIHKISLNKIKLIDQFLNFAKTKTKIRLGRNCWLQKIDGVLVLKQES